jgi:hypothetical protein
MAKNNRLTVFLKNQFFADLYFWSCSLDMFWEFFDDLLQESWWVCVVFVRWTWLGFEKKTVEVDLAVRVLFRRIQLVGFVGGFVAVSEFSWCFSSWLERLLSFRETVFSKFFSVTTRDEPLMARNDIKLRQSFIVLFVWSTAWSRWLPIPMTPSMFKTIFKTHYINVAKVSLQSILDSYKIHSKFHSISTSIVAKFIQIPHVIFSLPRASVVFLTHFSSIY